ncbi:MAG: tetratricopeptide repeat protein [Planctomycetota bacterium]
MKKATGNTTQGGVTLQSRPGLRSYCIMFCFTFVPLHLLTSLVGITLANTATEPPQPLPQSDLATPPDPNSPLGHELVREEISAVEGTKDQQNKSRLQEMIEQVRSIRLGTEEERTVAPTVVPRKSPPPEPNESSLDVQPEPDNQTKDIESRPSPERVKEQTLKMLRNLAEQPDKLYAPLELAEILFSGGSSREAVKFYQEALNRCDPNDARASNDRAWILFQIGNCLRHHDRPATAKTYGQLLTEYPESPWTELAKAEGKLIDWYLRDEPRKLIDEQEQARRK